MAKRTRFSRITNGLFDSAADLLLWYLGLIGGSVGKSPTSRGAYRSVAAADDFLREINHHTVRNAWYYLRRQGFVEMVKKDLFYEPLITTAAKKRLRSLLPRYQKRRPWDGRVYLITYDIPESKARSRDILREKLKILGAARLQQSVWVCPYNLERVLYDFVRGSKIEGTIIISNTGTNGGIGNESIENLVVRVYKLKRLNRRYDNFLSAAKKKELSRPLLAILYLSILKDDPQLPFELLPYWWLGDEAYQVYAKIIGKNGREA